MFNTRFMEELFKPQEIYSKKAMRTVFDRLAHASIMRLNTASMDKVGAFGHNVMPIAVCFYCQCFAEWLYFLDNIIMLCLAGLRICIVFIQKICYVFAN